MKIIKKVFIIFIFISVSFLDAKTFDYLTSKLDVDKANRLYKKGDYESAIELYKKALSKNTNSYQIYNNLALSKYANGDKEEALQLFDIAKSMITTNDKKNEIADLYYNSGVLNAASQNYKKSIDDLIKSLTINSKDDRAREAIEYSRKRLKEEENKNKNDSKNNNENNSDDNSNKDNSDKNNDNKDKNDSNNNNENDNKENKNNEDRDRENEDSKKNTPLRDREIEELLNSLRNLRKDDDYKQERLGNGYNNEKDW